MTEWIKNMLETMLISLDDNMANIIDVLQQSVPEWDNFAMGVSNNVIKPFALTIITICFLVEFLKITMQMDILKWEYAFKCFFKAAFAKVCIDVSSKLLAAIYATAAAWISDDRMFAGGTPNIGTTAWNAIKDEVADYKLLEAVGALASCGIIFIAVWVISIIVQVIAYARRFELTLYLAIAPLPCAFLPLEDGGGSRIPKKFIMSYAAVCLQGVFMIMSIGLYSMICSEAITSTLAEGESLFFIGGQILMGSLILVMAVIKSSGWAKSVLDAA